MSRNPYRQSVIATALALVCSTPALAGEAELLAQIQELAQKLEALQKQVSEAKTTASEAKTTASEAKTAAAAAPGSLQRQPGGPGAFSISLFGTVDAGIGRQSNIAAPTAAAKGDTTKVLNGGMAPSNFGISGALDFGEGYGGIFKLDTEFLTTTGANMLPVSNQIAPSTYNGSNGTTVLFNRAAYGGISSPYGTVTIGRQQVVAVDAVTKVEPSNYTNFFMSSVYGAYNLGNAIYGQGLVNTAPGKYSAGVSGNLDSRDNAMVKYVSPKLGGFTAILGYSPGAVAGSDSEGSKTAMGFSYDNGPFSVGGSHTQWNPVDVVTNKDAKYRLSNLGVGYRFGPLAVRAALGHTSLPAVTLKDSTNTNVAYSAATADVRGIGATYTASPKVDLVAAYYSKKYEITGGNNPKVDTLGLAATYKIFPNAKLYALYDHARSRGDNNANQTLGGHDSANAVAVGFSYSFNADFSR